jgi:mono/diheme cytochrome c family protein
LWTVIDPEGEMTGGTIRDAVARGKWSLAVLPLILLVGAGPRSTSKALQESNAARRQQSDVSAEQSGTTGHGGDIAHGKYLVHHVAMCIICHTPKTQDGHLQMGKLLQGGRIPVKSPYPHQQWAFEAPQLAGLPGGWTQASLAEFLQTGQTPTGSPIRLPMPPFRMNEHDAQSVAAYLHSLGVQ